MLQITVEVEAMLVVVVAVAAATSTVILGVVVVVVGGGGYGNSGCGRADGVSSHTPFSAFERSICLCYFIINNADDVKATRNHLFNLIALYQSWGANTNTTGTINHLRPTKLSTRSDVGGSSSD
ncbi:hypothetical protein BVC80_1715g24 [Macleaya cordata]|uniref:Uncharacterized protein n=1 Tax=Macleaya cordata TaxID=56857 RepID=A0A200Q224_MACCD|nr:hypothetical protein BVC80_1715g24 [Macleaya cordata]